MVRAGVIFTFTIICAVIAWIDIQKQKIYNETVAVLFVPAIVSFFVFPEIGLTSRLIGAVSVSSVMLFISVIVPGAFGGGDIKMMVPVGLFLGLERTLIAGIMAVFIGGLYSAALIYMEFFKRKSTGDIPQVRKTRFAFAPALCVGSIIACFWGDILWMQLHI